MPGDEVRLVREPDNPHGSSAILVTNSEGIGIGYVASEDSEVLAPILDGGRPTRAQVHELKGGLKDYPSLGCRICLAFDQEKMRSPKPLDGEQLHFAANAQQSSGCLGVIALAILAPTTILILS